MCLGWYAFRGFKGRSGEGDREGHGRQCNVYKGVFPDEWDDSENTVCSFFAVIFARSRD